MKKLPLIVVLLFVASACFSDYVARLFQYCLNNGVAPVAKVSFSLRDDGSGVYITAWNLAIPQPTDDMLPSEEESTNAVEEAWQLNKPANLKLLENMYVDFLTNTWTLACRSYGAIPAGATVTVENTSEATNVGYLLVIRASSYATYDLLAGEFDRLKTAIVANGGIMAKVRKH